MTNIPITTAACSTILNNGNEVIRINPSKGLEYSKDNGRNWHLRKANSSNYGEFKDLLVYGTEILIISAKGLYYSKDGCSNLHLRKAQSTSYGFFVSLANAGGELLVTTTNGLYYSRDGGCNLHRR